VVEAHRGEAVGRLTLTGRRSLRGALRAPGGFAIIPGAVPTYDYQCRSCERVIEVIHPMTSDGPATCEVCGGPMRRILYPAGIIFKGSGFYRTDSRAAANDGDGGTTKKETSKAGERSDAGSASSSASTPAPSGGAAPPSGSSTEGGGSSS